MRSTSTLYRNLLNNKNQEPHQEPDQPPLLNKMLTPRLLNVVLWSHRYGKYWEISFVSLLYFKFVKTLKLNLDVILMLSLLMEKFGEYLVINFQ